MNSVHRRRRDGRRVVVASIVALSVQVGGATAGDAEILRRVQTIPLEGVEGRMDHLTLDATGRTLYLAALANNTLEVVDLQAGRRVRQIKDIGEPQGVVRIPASDTLVVTSAEDGRCRFFDPALKIIAEIDRLPDADNVRYDSVADHLYVAYGDGGLAEIDAKTRKKIGDIPLAGHPESFQLESTGDHIFVNVPDARQVVVVNRRTRSIVATWPISEAKRNYPMALDEAKHRLLVGCREPAKLLVLDTESGRTVASQEVCGGADDVFIDRQASRVYVSGGDGCISIFEDGAGGYRELGRVQTSPGARTCLFVAETRKLYLAVPHHGDQPAAIWVYEVAP